MKPTEILHMFVDCLEEREKAYKTGEIETRIEYQIGKEDDDFCVLMIKLTYPSEHCSKLDDFVFVMFIHEDSIAYRAELSDEFDRSKHVDALEFVNKLNKEYVGSCFIVSASKENDLETIVMTKHDIPQLYFALKDIEYGLIEFAKTADFVYSEHWDDILFF